MPTPNPDVQPAPRIVADSLARESGLYRTTTNAFKDKLPPVPAVTFTAEHDRAFDADAPTGTVFCDVSARLLSPVPATTPLLLARYVRIRAGDVAPMSLRATAAIVYVIRGEGATTRRKASVEWAAGDIFRLPGGAAYDHRARSDSILWVVGNEPEVAFHGLEPPAPEAGRLGVVYFPAAEIEQQLRQVCSTPAPADATGRAIIFTTDEFERMASLAPSMTLALNTLDPGRAQRPHRHNSAAVTLVLAGSGCYSVVDGQRADWQPYATMVTPAAAAHSHHNEGDRLATFLIVQDGGVFYHARTIGFAFA